MDTEDALSRLALALAIGFLIGVERGWREREEAAGERAAGLRTFSLIGLFGGVWGLIAKETGGAPVGLAFLALAGAFTLFRWRETEREGTLGVTTVIAAFLTFAIGLLAALGDMAAAAAAGVATAALLAAKEWLHAWLRVLTWPELRAALILLAMSFVALPVLPDMGFGPYEALNPYQLWLMTIAIAGVSFIGYVAVKIAGARHGALIAGIAGGLVSSTATTLDLARKARAAPEGWRLALAGALAASAVMFLRVGLIVALFGAALLPQLGPALGAAAAVSIAAAIAASPPWRAAPEGAAGPRYANPFDLRVVLGFAAILALMLVLSRTLTESFGAEGGIALAAVAGLTDVDAITLSMTEMAGSRVSLANAEIAIFVAVAANSAAKSALSVMAGGARFGAAFSAVTAAALLAGGALMILA